jgi:hypothetical protein
METRLDQEPHPVLRTFSAVVTVGRDHRAPLRLRAFSSAFVLFLYVLLFITDGWGRLSAAGAIPWIIVATGVFGLVGTLLVRRRPLDMSSPVRLADSYRTAFFLGVAFSEMPGLGAFVGAVVTGHLVVYVVGLGFTAAGMALVAPTRADIARRQRDLMAWGSMLSLGRALLGPQSNLS